MNSIIRVKRSSPQNLYFEIHVNDGVHVVTSEPFSTFCKLETGLAFHVAAAQTPNALSVQASGDSTKVGLRSQRGRVRLLGQHPEQVVQRVISAVSNAQVIDERPPAQRRTDLSGPLSNLHR
jgi:hypothetical protein